MNQPNKYYRAFRLDVHLTLVVLILEYILGMYTALFVEFPDSLVDGNAWIWSMSQSAIIMAHILLGTLLLVGSILALGLGIASKGKAAIYTSIAGLAAVVIAYLGGSVFLANIQAGSYSFVMSLGFLAALLAYGVAYFSARQAAQAVS